MLQGGLIRAAMKGVIKTAGVKAMKKHGLYVCVSVVVNGPQTASPRQTTFSIPTGSSAMFYLAAAVSDFYIPPSEMSEHKIQSMDGPLQVRAIAAEAVS